MCLYFQMITQTFQNGRMGEAVGDQMKAALKRFNRHASNFRADVVSTDEQCNYPITRDNPIIQFFQ